MDFLPLAIFPAGSLASSVVTTVWVGVLVMCLLNLRFGWVLSGMIVPGYLVPLMIVRPWAVVATLCEAVVTYALVWAFSGPLRRLGGWSSVFGRDRFFALLLTSVVVRIAADVFAWPAVADALVVRGLTAPEFGSELQSFGLVIIALIANQFWKPGLLRGMGPFLVGLFLTWAIVRYGLMEFTNFSISNVAYMYEDVAMSILSSPKAYIVLLVTALLASRMNLFYGWDFNGIVLPALLALQWYDPSKVAMTFAEAFVILGVCEALLRTPWLAHRNIQGARKLLLFFNVGFAWKLLLGFAIGGLWPELKVSDYFAFGYLLSTLIALKMHDKEIAARLTRATLQTSLTGMVVASLFGFALLYVQPLLSSFGRAADPAASTGSALQTSAEPLLDRVRRDRVKLFATQAGGQRLQPGPAQADAFIRILRELDRSDALTDAAGLARASTELAALGYELELLGDRYLYLSERPPARGWGIFVLDPASPSNLVIEAPTAGAERGTREVACALMQAQGARALALAGGNLQVADAPLGALQNPQTLFHAFHRALARNDVLQVRRYTPAIARRIAGAPGVPPDRTQDAADEHAAGPAPTLWVKNSLPGGVNLPTLKRLLDDLDVRFAAPPYENLQRYEADEGFAELLVGRSSLARILGRQAVPTDVLDEVAGEQRIDGYLSEWVFSGKARILPRGSGSYRRPRLEELLFWDEEILAPLVNLVGAEYDDGKWSERGRSELASIAVQAGAFGYTLQGYRHVPTRSDFLILSEAPGAAAPRGWGLYILRLGPAQNLFVEVPRPLYEVGSFEFGVAVFQRVDARALLVAGAHPAANLDGTADVLSSSNLRSLFSLASQVLVREAGGAPSLIVQMRGFGFRDDVPVPEADAVLAFDGATRRSAAGDALRKLFTQTLEQAGLQHVAADGSLPVAGYEPGLVAQRLYMSAASRADFAVLRLSPVSRFAFRQPSMDRIQQNHFAALDIASAQIDLRQVLLAAPLGRAPAPALQAAVLDYQLAPDIVALRRVQALDPGLALTRAIDRDSQQTFLVVRDPAGNLMGAYNLHPRRPYEAIRLTRPLAASDLDTLLFGGVGALLAPKGG